MSSPPPSTHEIALIAEDMRALDQVIGERLSTSVALIRQVCGYIISSGGKRLRPSLLLLTCGALGYAGPQRLNLAAVIEFIHTATLLHDDVVDDSSMRRGRATANSTFGNPASVLVGDFLYSRAFQMMVTTQNMRVMEILAEATNVISEGEVQQLLNTRDIDLDEAGYLHVIRCKTAKLFEASARLGAVLAGSPPEIERAFADFGQALGTAFQLIDDVLDYDGDAHTMGKNLGDDLREGKVTLPIIVAMQRSSAQDREVIRHAMLDENHDSLERVVTVVRGTGAIDAARAAAAREAARAMNALESIPDTPYKGCLLQLAGQLLDRQS